MVKAFNKVRLLKTKTAKKEFLQKLIEKESDNAETYNMGTDYEVGSFISHPKFGLGFIQEILGKTKVSVFFENGEKVLLQNWVKS